MRLVTRLPHELGAGLELRNPETSRRPQVGRNMELTPQQIELIRPIAEKFWPMILEVRREANAFSTERRSLQATFAELQNESQATMTRAEHGNASWRALYERLSRYAAIIGHLDEMVQWHHKLATKYQDEMIRRMKEIGVDLTADEWPEFFDDIE